MSLSVDYPWVLLLLLACIPPLLGQGAAWVGVSSLTMAPSDGASRAFDVLLRVIAAGAMAGVVLGLAGLHRGQGVIWRTGSGAHIVIVLDRSLSMDEPFALQGQKAQETKTEAASRIADQFFARRPHDSFALVPFSTAPILAMPITPHRDAIGAAMAAMRDSGLANTDVGGGISLALSLFAHDSGDATRVILFVSDGAALIEQKVKDYIRREAPLQRAHLYYLYLRAGDDPSLAEDMTQRFDSSHPAALDAFFHTLGIPYRGFEARDPGAVAEAVGVIDALESHPIRYQEKVARRDYDAACYAGALLCLLLGLLARLAERGFVVETRRT